MQDFSIGFVLVAVVCALTFGQVGDTVHGENFIYQMQNSHVRNSPSMTIFTTEANTLDSPEHALLAVHCMHAVLAPLRLTDMHEGVLRS